jgi:aminoglycoside 6'-N-acetyltransferase
VTDRLRGELVELRPPTEADAPRLAEILTMPEVARWWPRYDLERVREEFKAGLDDVVVYVIEADGQVVGAIQYGEEAEPDYRHANMDIFLDPAVHGRGLGADALRTLAGHLFERGHHRIVIDPSAANTRAIRSYERIGFRPVGIMRRYERGPDGTFHDGLLMDLLPEELH